MEQLVLILFCFVIEGAQNKIIYLFVETKADNMRDTDKLAIAIQEYFFLIPWEIKILFIRWQRMKSKFIRNCENFGQAMIFIMVSMFRNHFLAE